MGEQKVKNIKKPVKAFAVRLAGGTRRNTGPSMTPALELPDKPSIAVIPFDNMSGDAEQEYFADGITEDIITALSKVSEMFVIARNSTFAYKGSSPDVRQVARELGVRNVLEGSVRKAGNRVRITAQLIDASTGNHLWAERYDRELAGIFELQDEITQEVVTALQVRLTEGEQVRLRRRQTDNVAAWECYARGQAYLRRFNQQDNAQARELLDRAVEIAPEFASAWSLLAWVHYLGARVGSGESAERSLERADACADRSLALDNAQSDAYAIRGSIRMHQRRYDEGVEDGRRAVDLGPNVADSYVLLAHTLNYIGQPQESIGLIEQAMRLSPFYPDWYLGIAGISYRLLGRYEDAIAADHERLARNPDNIFSDFRLAANYEKLGRHDQARAHIAIALKKYPKWSLAQIRVSEPYRDKSEMERYVGLLRKAGLPE
jgi:TolB-like protein